jgi:hypothetical protein
VIEAFEFGGLEEARIAGLVHEERVACHLKRNLLAFPMSLHAHKMHTFYALI